MRALKKEKKSLRIWMKKVRSLKKRVVLLSKYMTQKLSLKARKMKK